MTPWGRTTPKKKPSSKGSVESTWMRARAETVARAVRRYTMAKSPATQARGPRPKGKKWSLPCGFRAAPPSSQRSGANVSGSVQWLGSRCRCWLEIMSVVPGGSVTSANRVGVGGVRRRKMRTAGRILSAS